MLKKAFGDQEGTIFFEFSIPRMGKRVDVLAIIKGVVFVIEFKVGEHKYHRAHLEQVWDYALDLKNFHEPSHKALLAPILVATEAKLSFLEIATTSHNDNLLLPMKVNKVDLGNAIASIVDVLKKSRETSFPAPWAGEDNTFVTPPVAFCKDNVDPDDFSKGRYSPTPTIVEAALSLYHYHTVDDITRSDAKATNLTKTTSIIAKIIKKAKSEKRKIICFVTGVPGAGKTLVGLRVATSHLGEINGNASVYLSGNGPLVAILQEALARDKIKNEKAKGRRFTKGQAKASVKAFIQNIHHYRDAYLVDPQPPYDHVAIFDEAQRAWNREQTVKFMKQKKGRHSFDYSEPEFLISCLDRHQDWAVIVCLVGGGQEINTGEAGISEWLSGIKNKFTSWEVCISPNLTAAEYAASDVITNLQNVTQVHLEDDLHLGVSMRSFRAEHLSLFVQSMLDMDKGVALDAYTQIKGKYPIVLARDLQKAKEWLRQKARGSERYGLIVSSQAQRLKPFGIDVKSPMHPVYWFLNDKEDVRSSYYLEDVATEFHVQGLELDWACVTWDGDLRYSPDGWGTFSFVGSKWQNIHKEARKSYLINAYRVLLTRARQGMVIVVPEGSLEDPTRQSSFYDPTFYYLKGLGIEVL